MSDPDTLENGVDEQRRVDLWNRRQLVGLGFEKRDAELLIAASVSWHDAKRLLDRGCPLEVAFNLLV